MAGYTGARKVTHGSEGAELDTDRAIPNNASRGVHSHQPSGMRGKMWRHAMKARSDA